MHTETESPKSSLAASASGNYRWVICALLLFATTINSLDKFVISYLKVFFCSEGEFAGSGFGWQDVHYSYITTSFTIVWSVATIFAGIIIDKIGSRRGLALAVAVWSTFEMLNALAGPRVVWHCVMRNLLGVGEAGHFPGAIKTAAEWFPKKERAFATGISNTGASIGAMIAALFVPWCLAFHGGPLGWRLAFVYTGALGFVWLFFWWILGGMPAKMRGKRLSEAEYAHIHQDEDEGEKTAQSPRRGVSWFKLLTYRQTWAYSTAKFMTDGIWWFYLFWLPSYLVVQFPKTENFEGMTSQLAGRLSFIVWGVAIAGSVLGGRIPMSFMNRGWSVYRARLGAMVMFAALPLLVLFVQVFASNQDLFGAKNALVCVIVIISIAVAAHQAWSANLYTTPADWFPGKAVASVSGIGIAAGGLGGALVQLLVGQLTTHYKAAGNVQTAYSIIFVVAAFVYLAAWVVIKLLVPRHKPVSGL